VAIRNIRRDGNEAVKKLLKDKIIAEDEDRRAHDEIQKMTDAYMGKLDQAASAKEKEIGKSSKGPLLEIETTAVHAGRRIDPATGAVTPPIHLSTTFERSPDGEYPRGYSYSREDNPNRRALEECLSALEGGKEALAFSSGLAVVAALAQGLEPGDHILAPDDVYYGLRKVIGDVFAKSGLEIAYVDMTNLVSVRAAVRPSTRLVWIETPSNPLMKITDLAAVAAIARRANAISVCDGTFATPILQRPFEQGIDMVTHSTTKYIGGHSDVMGGALVTKYDNYLFERAARASSLAARCPRHSNAGSPCAASERCPTACARIRRTPTR